jgi:hypothetical protein
MIHLMNNGIKDLFDHKGGSKGSTTTPNPKKRERVRKSQVNPSESNQIQVNRTICKHFFEERDCPGGATVRLAPQIWMCLAKRQIRRAGRTRSPFERRNVRLFPHILTYSRLFPDSHEKRASRGCRAKASAAKADRTKSNPVAVSSSDFIPGWSK